MNVTYKTRLEAMLTEITTELSSVGIHDPRNPSDWIAIPREHDTEEPDENVSADNVEEWNERTAIVATLESQYNGIVGALDRIEKNTFGACEVCNTPIEEKRLEANPISRTCIAHINDESTLKAL